MSQHTEATQRLLRRTARTSATRVVALHVVDLFFARYRLPRHVLEAIATKASKVHRFKRGDECFRLDARRIFLLASGCVREEQHWGTPRIWREGTLFGNWCGLHHESRGTALREGRGLFLGVEDVRQLGGEFPELLLALAGLTHERLEAAETVYGASKKTSMHKVAELLVYLASARVGHLDDQSFLFQEAPRNFVQGPTQADIADALGLSRAAVEKAIADLRHRGALRGDTRRVRFYQIDHAVMQDVVLEGM
jgi:CRP-like cAMP-binding protein